MKKMNKKITITRVIKRIFIITVTFIVLTSCSPEEITDIPIDYTKTNDYDKKFEYQTDENFNKNGSVFTVDDNGTLMIAIHSDTGEKLSGTTSDGDTVTSYEYSVYENLIYTYDLSGNQTEILKIGDKGIYNTSIMKMAYGGGKLYYFKYYNETPDSYENKSMAFYSSDLKSNEKLICKTNSYSNYDIKKLEIVDNYAYFIATDENNVRNDYELFNPLDMYVNNGESINRINLDTGETEKIFTEMPVMFSVTFDGNLLIYAYETKGGFYFTEYSVAEKTFGKKMYNNLNLINDMQVYDEDNNFIYLTKGAADAPLFAASLSADDGTLQILQSVATSYQDNVYIKNGYIFIRNIKNNNSFERYKVSEYIRFNKPITLISAEQLEITPFNCGYNFKTEYLGYDGFAMQVLALNADYDLCHIFSSQSFSGVIKEKGVFYPLNEVEGVSEYIDSCFDYIKDLAATDGDIWMIPISVDVPFIVYNKPLCMEYGLDFENGVTFEQLMDFNLEYKGSRDISKKYFLWADYYKNLMLSQYLLNNKKFDTDSFRELAPFIKEKYNNEKDGNLTHFSECGEALFAGDYENFLFDNGNESVSSSGLVFDSDIIHISSLPKLYPEGKNIANISFICVNPNSNNLENTLQYVSELVKYLNEKKNFMIFSEKEHYGELAFLDELYEIYKNAGVEYNIPYEIYGKSLADYLLDKISLEDMIKQADKNLGAFYNE